MTNRYETVFILTPVLSEAQMKEAVDKFRDFITSANGEVVHDENWGLRKLAYPIQKKSTGFYHLFDFEVDGDFIEKLEVEFRRDERVLRFFTVKMDKYAVAYADKKSSRKAAENEKVQEA